MSNTTIRQLLAELTLEEKAMLCTGKDFWNLHGIERLNLPSIMVTDGPTAYENKQVKAITLV